MSCPQCRGIERMFDARVAERDLDRYRRKGPNRTTRMLLELLRAEGVEGATVLDVGGGVGAIHHELLDAGAREATQVDAAPHYLSAARDEARRRGHDERVRFEHGDFVEVADGIPPADVVTLDRVICCYHDMPALVSRSGARARRLYGLVYPRDDWWVRRVVPLENLVLWLRRCPFRVYVHPTAAVDAEARAQGLTLRARKRTIIWQVVVYARPDGGAP